MSGGHWAQASEVGARWGLRLSFWVHRRLGRWPFRAVMLFVAGYFFLTRGDRRRASLDYLGRAAAAGIRLPRPRLWASFRHFLTFSEVVLDKLLAWDPDWSPKSLAFTGEDEVYARLRAGQGVLLVGSHLGNLEVARALGKGRKELRITVLVHTLHAEAFNQLVRETWPDSQLDLVQVTEVGPDTALLLKQRVEAGGVVLIAGDRVPVKGRGVAWAPFLGSPAPFPVGPYALASVLECPVYLFFCLGTAGRFRLFYEPFAERVALPRSGRRQALDALAARFAARLEHYCGLAPLQWGNFYPLWESLERQP